MIFIALAVTYLVVVILTYEPKEEIHKKNKVSGRLENFPLHYEELPFYVKGIRSNMPKLRRATNRGRGKDGSKAKKKVHLPKRRVQTTSGKMDK